MRNLILAGAAALAFTTVPAAAQDAVAVDAEGNAYVLTDAQQGMYDGWPADRQTSYDAWPSEVQEYYWTLTPAQVEGWWVLTDDQRVKVYQMTPEQRATTWTQIAAQMNGAPPPPSAGAAPPPPAGAAPPPPAGAMTPPPAAAPPPPPAPMASGNMRFVPSETVQPAPAAKTEYPICEKGVTDGCINPREAGKNYGNVPLDYWPGKPASEIDEPLPAKKPGT